MFKNIGKKIKVLAKVLCWIGIVCSIIIGLLVILLGASGGVEVSEVPGVDVSVSGVGSIVAGVVIIVLGCLISWIGSFTTYGFGELIDNVKKINDRQDLMS